MKTLLILLLFTMTAYSAPPDHANNPDGDDMPEEAECVFCDLPIGIDTKSLILGCFMTAFVMSIYKPKKHS